MILAALIVASIATAPIARAAGKSDSGKTDKSSSPTSSKASGSGGKAETPRTQAKAAVERAQIDYKLGRFQEALDGYRRAYELFQAPSLLFDMGQCHRNLGNPEKAIFFFEGYLREEPRIDPDRRRLTQDLIADARVDLQRKMAAASAAAADARAAAAPPPPPPRPVHLEAVDSQRVIPAALITDGPERDRSEPRAERSIASHWWFWTAIAGACVVAAGAAVYYATGEPRQVPPQTSLGPYMPAATMTSTAP